MIGVKWVGRDGRDVLSYDVEQLERKGEMKVGQASDLAGAALDVIGADVSYYRDLDDRQYFTGVEVALVLGTAVVIEFCIGFVKGLSGEMGAGAGQWVGGKLRKLVHLRKKAGTIDAKTVGELQTAVADLQRSLDELLDEDLLARLRTATDSDDLAVQEVRIYMVNRGFPEDRAAILADRVSTAFRARVRGDG